MKPSYSDLLDRISNDAAHIRELEAENERLKEVVAQFIPYHKALEACIAKTVRKLDEALYAQIMLYESISGTAAEKTLCPSNPNSPPLLD